MLKGSGKNETTPLLKKVTWADDIESCEIGIDTEEPTPEPQIHPEIIIRVLFRAWRLPSPRGSGEQENTDYVFRPRSLKAVSRIWRKIKAHGDLLPESEVIIRGLAEALIERRLQLKVTASSVPSHVVKEGLTEHVEKIVAESWQEVLALIEAEDEEKAKRDRERRRRSRELLERHLEIAEVLWFYRPFTRFDYTGRFDCRILCINLCLCFSVFVFQVLIHGVLLAWPLSIGIMGGLYRRECPMSFLLTYAMMAVGVAGTLALLTRLSFAFYEKFSREEIRSIWLWILLKALEFIFLVFVIIQLYSFFSQTPSFVVGSPKYCDETFYNFVHWINYVSIVVASMWLLVYIIKGILTWQLRKYSLRPW